MIRITAYILTLLASIAPIYSRAQENFITISGTVADKQTNKVLEAASITIPGTNIGTVTNADGYFSLRISPTDNTQQLLISHIGYDNLLYPIGNNDAINIKFKLTPNAYAISEINIYGGDAREMVLQAVSKIATNYEDKSNLLTGFYREIIQKRRNYITVTESVIGIYKSPYRSGIRNDRVQLYKGRKIIDQKSKDTVVVKIAGGPNLPVYIDIAKNMEFMLDKREIENYDFTHDRVVNINNKPHYAINFKPRFIADYALFCGTLYIEEKTQTITRAELNLMGNELIKATKDMLRKKPVGLRFKLNELRYIISYRQNEGRSYLYYVSCDMKFNCDWRKRLFHTNYTISSEMVTTDRQTEPAENIMTKDAFKHSQSLSDRVADFYDTDFWGNYNIIEPTETLEHAIDRLKKRNK